MTIQVNESAIKRIAELRETQNKPGLKLRITVDSGGCSGFQYILELTDEHTDEDSIFKDTVITDELSIPYLKDSEVKFERGLAGAEFVIDNPNAVQGCGCGTSFSV